MTLDTRQLFSVRSEEYASARPHYPRELLAHIVGLCPDTARAWDCATGSGQAAVALAEWFTQVDATDVSEPQLRHATAHPRVRYALQAAEQPDFPDQSFSLVTVAQALHWFDFGRFWPQVQRVLRPGGIFAAWTYTLPYVSEALDPLIEQHLLNIIKPYWAPNNQLAMDGYVNVPFPFQEITMPAITMRLNWSMAQFIAYVHTWSASRRCEEDQGPQFFDAFCRELEGAWGDPLEVRPVHMEFFCRVGRHAR